jgi:hypothetical protein
MDILAIMFFIFGCIFKVKGLVITSLILSVFVIIFSTLSDKRTPTENQKKRIVRLICLACDIILFGSAIIKLCIW